ncbi:DUF2971 domain-containing protein [Methylobacter tundripaludum]|uniref:DUF2971 domain-containing protein n=1 Tax=Methylobacter tundripaludum TaxID=173365 RepID=UPI0006917D85|nr:DUF2971 domain-containing protein [Methylobacter tundripaludum]
MFKTILRYKYVPFDEDGSLCIIKDGTMKFTRPSELNDPFDCDPERDEHKHLEYIKEQKDLLKKAGDSLGLSPAQRIQNKGVMLKRVEIAIQNREFSQKAVNEFGICSLSRDPLNLLMWAHYAKEHTGFVIEFCIPTQAQRFSEEDALKWLVPHKVKYEQTKPIVSPDDGKLVNVDKYFLVKGHDWKYEQEERVIDSLRKPGIHPYERKIILKSVIAGMRMCDDHFVILKNTVEAMNAELGINVAVYKAEPLKGKFALSIPERDDLSSNTAL